MNRFAFARTAFVVLGAWFLLESLGELPVVIQFRNVEKQRWFVLSVAMLPLLGVLVIFWSRALAQWTVGSYTDSPESPAPLRSEDLQTTGFGLVGLLSVMQNLPFALVRIHEVPSRWSARGEANGEGWPRVDDWWFQVWVQSALSAAIGLGLVLGARPAARWWGRTFRGPELRTPEPEDGAPSAQAPLRPHADAADLLAAALAVLGVFLMAEALPVVLATASLMELRSPFEWTPDEPAPSPFGPLESLEVLRLVIGLALFVGARGLSKLWRRLRSVERAAPAASGREA